MLNWPFSTTIPAITVLATLMSGRGPKQRSAGTRTPALTQNHIGHITHFCTHRRYLYSVSIPQRIGNAWRSGQEARPSCYTKLSCPSRHSSVCAWYCQVLCDSYLVPSRASSPSIDWLGMSVSQPQYGRLPTSSMITSCKPSSWRGWATNFGRSLLVVPRLLAIGFSDLVSPEIPIIVS